MAKYRVTCEHCDLNLVFDDARPSAYCIENGRADWSAKAAAVGAVNGHCANIDHSLRQFHRANVQEV